MIVSAWTSPSNIALIKYWGKLPEQIPANASISFTLKHSLTKMEIKAAPKDSSGISLEFYFEGLASEKFAEKISKFLETQLKRFPWILNHHLVIHSSNTFPHSSGIASSASSMSALCLCLMSLDEEFSGKISVDAFLQESSHLSRLASGSAGRSVYPFMATWGESKVLPEGSNLHASAVKVDLVHRNFHHYCDSIIIVDEKEKSVSSRAGHSLMDSHPFKAQRYERAQHNMRRLLEALKSGDREVFAEVVEEEALMLHALMMTSTPSYILLRPESLAVIEKVRVFRSTQKIPVCFTIDAGPNIHLLYPQECKGPVLSWIKEEFPALKVIHDEVGDGPHRIKD